MERVDVFVIGGGGTGSDVTYALAGAGLKVVMAEREVLGGECSHYGCDPTKAMLKAARIATIARRAGEYGINVPTVEVDFPAVMRRVRRLIEEETAAGPGPFQERGARVLMQEARLLDEHRVELEDGTVFEADRVVMATGSAPTAPPIPGSTRAATGRIGRPSGTGRTGRSRSPSSGPGRSASSSRRSTRGSDRG